MDEYQDINLEQYRLLRLLTAGGANLCVIGDPDQAIYGFRGAKRKYFLRFQQDFPKAKTYFLTQNYRSTQTIISASTQVIARSEFRVSDFKFQVPSSKQETVNPKQKTRNPKPIKLDLHHAPTEKAEAEYVVHQTERMVGGTSSFAQQETVSLWQRSQGCAVAFLGRY